MAIDTAKATIVKRSLTTKFTEAMEQAEPFWPTLCAEVNSDGADEEYAQLGAMPGVREWLGDRQFQELRAASFAIKNRNWESSLLVQKTDIEDDRLGIYGPLMEELANEAAYHPDELLIEVLNAGESSPCFDGQLFFDTDHSWGDSGTQDNDLTFNATDPDAVTPVEAQDAFHAARKALLSFKNDRGKYFNARPIAKTDGAFLIFCSLELEKPMAAALKSTILGNNSNIVLSDARIVASPHITARRFYTFHLGGAFRPFVFQKRKPLEWDWKGLDDLETKDVKFLTSARYALGYFAWWKATQTVFT